MATVCGPFSLFTDPAKLAIHIKGFNFSKHCTFQLQNNHFIYQNDLTACSKIDLKLL